MTQRAGAEGVPPDDADSDRLILFYLEAMKPGIPEKWHARMLPRSGRTDALPFSWLAKFRLLRS